MIRSNRSASSLQQTMLWIFANKYPHCNQTTLEMRPFPMNKRKSSALKRGVGGRLKRTPRAMKYFGNTPTYSQKKYLVISLKTRDRHEIDIVPGSKYCVTGQWPLPRNQVKAIDEFFKTRRKAGHVRESTSPHSSPTFCVKKSTGGWRTVHAFNKLNAATVPAQKPIPRRDVIIDGMSGSTVFSALNLRDGFYQILMHEKDIYLTAVSTPSGIFWE